jgi:endonuclease/exonuclease/phosphatase (EEP) superfamily protein YafD
LACSQERRNRSFNHRYASLVGAAYFGTALDRAHCMRRTTRAEEARNWLAERQNEAIAEFTLLVSTVAMVAAMVAMIAPAHRRTSRAWLLLSLVQSFFGNQSAIILRQPDQDWRSTVPSYNSSAAPSARP